MARVSSNEYKVDEDEVANWDDFDLERDNWWWVSCHRLLGV